MLEMDKALLALDRMYRGECLAEYEAAKQQVEAYVQKFFPGFTVAYALELGTVGAGENAYQHGGVAHVLMPIGEQASDCPEAKVYRTLEQEARALISDYERLIAHAEQAEVVELIATPEDDESEWKAIFVDGHVVFFWIANHQMLLENRVHIVSREN